MFIFKKAINRFLALGVTASCFVSPNFVKADRHFMSWQRLSKRLEFDTEKDDEINRALLNVKSHYDCGSKIKFNPHWYLVMQLGNTRFYAMTTGCSYYYQRSRFYNWILYLEDGGNENIENLFISHMDRKTPGCNTGKVSLYIKDANSKYLFEIPLFTASIVTGYEKAVNILRIVPTDSSQINKAETPKVYSLYNENDDEIVDSIFSNFLVTEIDSDGKEKVLRWPFWITKLVGNIKFKKPKKETKSKELNSNHFPLNYMLDNESLMWFS